MCLDEASSVCNPKELSHDSSNKARIFTIAEHAKRVKLLRAKRELRLRRVSKSDAFKVATRTYETFGLGAFATWVSTEHAISAVSDDEVTVMFCGDFCVPNLHTLDDMHSAFVRYVYLFRSLDARGLVFVLFLRVNPRANCEGAQINISEFVQLFNELFPAKQRGVGGAKNENARTRPMPKHVLTHTKTLSSFLKSEANRWTRTRKFPTRNACSISTAGRIIFACTKGERTSAIRR